MSNIPLFDLHFDLEFRQKFHQGCEEIFNQAYLTNHTFVRQFENKFSDFNRFEHSVAVSNGTAALECALLAIGVSGKQVIIPSNTFIATAVAVINAGGIPRIVDIDSTYTFMDLDKVENILKEENNIGAVIAVHIGGHTSPQVKLLASLLLKFNVSLVEDCAHSLGSELNGQKSGSFSRFSCFSFFMTKVMTTGEGGMVSCHAKEDFEKLKSIRQFGRDPDNDLLHSRTGSNFKLTEFQGLMGVLELDRLEARIDKRRLLATTYQRLLEGSRYRAISDHAGQKGSYYKQVIISDLHQDVVKRYLDKFNIPLTGGTYYSPLHQQPILKKFLREDDYSNSNYFSTFHFCPPCFPELNVYDVEFISKKLLELSS